MKPSLILAITLCFCATRASAAGNLKLEVVQKMLPGTATQKQISDTFGKPDNVLDLKNLHGSPDAGASWEYFEGSIPKLTIAFEGSGQITSGWSWEISKGDSEKDLRTALKRFAEASWEVETVKWVNPHQVPTECYFRDNKQGISITFNRARKEVVAISRWNPTRKISSSDDEKPPRFCFEENCIEAKLSKDVFKEHSLCELPK